MQHHSSRRDFLKQAGAAAVIAGGVRVLGASAPAAAAARDYKISLAAWSLHKTIGKGEGKVPCLDLPKMAREEFGIEAIELVSGMLASRDKAYMDELAKNAATHNVKILLTMVDGEGDIGHEKPERCEKAVERHKFWIDTTADFGGHSIRMNWKGAPDETAKDPAALDAFIARSVPGFRALCDYGDTKNINVILENHWGPSSYPEAVKKLAAAVDHPRFGTLPDFGNFPEDVDKYEAVDVLMNYAKAVSAKCYDFDDATGQETKIDFEKMIQIVCDKHGYKGYIGIEYEGNRLSEQDGIKAAKALLEKLRGA